MTSESRHVWVRGAYLTARQAVARAAVPNTLRIECHRNAVGAYGTVRHLLQALVPELNETHPQLLERHKFVILYPLPRLADVVGDGPLTLAERTSFDERTRYFSNEYVRSVSHGIVDLLLEVAAQRARDGAGRLALRFDNVEAADATDQEFLAALVRRADPRLLTVVVTSGETSAPTPGLARALRRARVVVACQDRAPASESAAELARAWIDADGVGDDAAQLAAYIATDAAQRAAWHDARAEELIAAGDDTLLVAPAVAWHRERGSDPAGAGRAALRAVLDHYVDRGYSTGTIDVGERGRRLADPQVHGLDWYHFTAKLGGSLVSHGRAPEALELYREVLRRSTRPRTHMTVAYAIAMLYTCFLEPRDHDRAMEYVNIARAIAATEPDPIERASLEVYAENGLALIEMHRGELERSYELVDRGLARLDCELPADSWLLHRSQLMHNRARVLAALGRHDEALRAFNALIDLDPFYADYRADRASVHIRLGDTDRALADYDWAINTQPPFPALFVNRGTLRAARGEQRCAAADYRRATELDPAARDAWAGLAEALLAVDEVTEAEQAARDGLAWHPHDTTLSCLLVDVLDARGLDAEATALLERVLDADPTAVSALARRAARYYAEGRYDAALADLDTASGIDDSADLRLNRGLVGEAAGDLDQALEDLAAARALPGADVTEIDAAARRCSRGAAPLTSGDAS